LRFAISTKPKSRVPLGIDGFCAIYIEVIFINLCKGSYFYEKEKGKRRKEKEVGAVGRRNLKRVGRKKFV
jgi:hypothetical protein